MDTSPVASLISGPLVVLPMSFKRQKERELKRENEQILTRDTLKNRHKNTSSNMATLGNLEKPVLRLETNACQDLFQLVHILRIYDIPQRISHFNKLYSPKM